MSRIWERYKIWKEKRKAKKWDKKRIETWGSNKSMDSIKLGKLFKKCQQVEMMCDCCGKITVVEVWWDWKTFKCLLCGLLW